MPLVTRQAELISSGRAFLGCGIDRVAARGGVGILNHLQAMNPCRDSRTAATRREFHRDRAVQFERAQWIRKAPARRVCSRPSRLLRRAGS